MPIGTETSLVVGVDVGGTKVAAGVVDGAGHLHSRVQQPTDTRSTTHTLQSIAATVRLALAAAHLQPAEVQAVGLGVPGTVDPVHGVGIMAVNLGWRDAPVRDYLAAELVLPCAVENDVKAATLGEWRFGEGRGLDDMVYLNVGTGIAAGVIVAGQLLRGANGMAGEIGHAVVDAQGPLCKCGGRGCLEALAAGPAIAARAVAALQAGATSGMAQLTADQGGRITAETVFAAAAAGDALAGRVLADVGAYLGQAIQWLLMAYDPQLVVLGGGVVSEPSAGSDAFLAAVRQTLDRLAAQSAAFRLAYREGAVRLSGLGREAGVLGAAALVL
jgi:glucokinase